MRSILLDCDQLTSVIHVFQLMWGFFVWVSEKCRSVMGILNALKKMVQQLFTWNSQRRYGHLKPISSPLELRCGLRQPVSKVLKLYVDTCYNTLAQKDATQWGPQDKRYNKLNKVKWTQKSKSHAACSHTVCNMTGKWGEQARRVCQIWS